jgi:hypothetical protein
VAHSSDAFEAKGLKAFQLRHKEDWAAAGLKDTLLRCEVKPEVVYGNEKAVQPRVQA